jgi:hypothetical protein
MDQFRFYEVVLIGAVMGYAIDVAERKFILHPIGEFLLANPMCWFGAMSGFVLASYNAICKN